MSLNFSVGLSVYALHKEKENIWGGSLERNGRGLLEGHSSGKARSLIGICHFCFFFHCHVVSTDIFPLNNHLSLFSSHLFFMDPSFHLSIHWKLFIRCVAISGVTEELWTKENERALDQFIVDTSITTVVVYKDTSAGLRVEYSMPVPVQHIVLSTFNSLSVLIS